ncbi:hypothetical protein ABTK80_21635, partial [Acinetobacter baumannii]
GNQFATAANNDLVRVRSVAAHGLTLDCLPTGWAVDAGTGQAVRIGYGDVVRNGATPVSFTLERLHADASGGVFDFFGMQ